MRPKMATLVFFSRAAVLAAWAQSATKDLKRGDFAGHEGERGSLTDYSNTIIAGILFM
jgi:hypothetical protein